MHCFSYFIDQKHHYLAWEKYFTIMLCVCVCVEEFTTATALVWRLCHTSIRGQTKRLTMARMTQQLAVRINLNSVNYVKTLWPLVTIFKCKCRVSHLLSAAYKLTSLCPFFVYGPCASTASLTPVIFQIK